jgi:hypothetical protein
VNAEAIAEMLAKDRAEWAALTAVLDAQPDGTVHQPGTPPWSARDVYTHFARWITHSTDGMEAWLEKRVLSAPEGSDDKINARWQAEDAALTFAEARARAIAAYERRLAVIETIPPDRWDQGMSAWANGDGSGHYAGHRRYIEGTQA